MSDSEASPRTPSLEAKELTVRAGGRSLLNRVTFSLHPGELAAVIGPSGSGKSTLLKTVLGIRSLGSGGVEGRGAPGQVGYVPQFVALHRVLSVRGALDYALQLRRPEWEEGARLERIEEVCRELSLSDRLNVAIRKLSGGQQKRVAIAMELLTEPQWLILDEPASGLDPGLEAQLMDTLRELANQGRVVLTTTHAMSSLNRCDAVFLMMEGYLVYGGSPGDALAFFEVERFEDIFPRLSTRPAQGWATAFMGSPWNRGALQRTRRRGNAP